MKNYEKYERFMQGTDVDVRASGAVIHEIGHTLGLYDVFRDTQLGGRPDAPTPQSSLTRSNYMDYFVQKRMFFKTQINTIIKNLTPPTAR